MEIKANIPVFNYETGKWLYVNYLVDLDNENCITERALDRLCALLNVSVCNRVKLSEETRLAAYKYEVDNGIIPEHPYHDASINEGLCPEDYEFYMQRTEDK